MFRKQKFYKIIRDQLVLINFNIFLYYPCLDIHIYHSALQNYRPNPCANNDCSHLCLLSANDSFVCACPKGMELNVDNQNCYQTTKDLTLLIGITDRLFVFDHQEFGKHSDGTGKTLPIFISKMAFNSLNGEVIIADNIQGSIYSYNLKTFKLTELVVHNIGNISAIAFGEAHEYYY